MGRGRCGSGGLGRRDASLFQILPSESADKKLLEFMGVGGVMLSVIGHESEIESVGAGGNAEIQSGKIPKPEEEKEREGKVGVLTRKWRLRKRLTKQDQKGFCDIFGRIFLQLIIF